MTKIHMGYDVHDYMTGNEFLIDRKNVRFDTGFNNEPRIVQNSSALSVDAVPGHRGRPQRQSQLHRIQWPLVAHVDWRAIMQRSLRRNPDARFGGPDQNANAPHSAQHGDSSIS